MTGACRIVIAGLFILYYTASAFSQEPDSIDLGGSWQFRQIATGTWMPAYVPGVVHLDLLQNKVIPDPFFRDNEKKLQWIGEVGWEYQRSFTYNAPDLPWNRVELVCRGLDTYARVYLNDSLIFKADNMFREWSADIRHYLHAGQNTLRIIFPSVVAENKSRYEQLPFRLPGGEKVVCRKAAYHFGWDWGPVFITCGIWRPVFIRQWNVIKVNDVHFLQEKLTDSAAQIAARFNLSSEIRDSVRILLYIDSVEIQRKNYFVNKGNSIIQTYFSIPEPLRWWPNGMGMPNLYHVGYEIYSGKKRVASGHQQIGLRTIELVQEPDSIGRSFYFKVNGLPVFMKGANYIPQDNFLPRVTDFAYKALIRDVKEAHMNMLRVWGGGIYENDIFYDLCDENGILVWQDFMFACALYPGDTAFLENVKAEAVDNIVRLRSHPCLALWCGNNEIDEGWKNWGWQKQYRYSPEDSARIYRDYQLIFDSILPVSVQRYDSLRSYISSSPLHGWGRSASMKEGDSHYWGVWWGKEPFTMYEKKVGRFMSEYGFQGFPDLSTIGKFTSPQDCQLNSPVMKVHQKHPVGYETIEEYMIRDYRKPVSFEMYDYVSQLVQADGMRIAIQAHRKAKPGCMGTLYWQMNDCWPVVSWSSRDYYGKKKAFYYESRRLFDTILIITVAEEENVNVYISSDSHYPGKATLHIRLTDFTGKSIKDEYIPVVIGANTSHIFYSISRSGLLRDTDPAAVVFSASFTGPDEIRNKSLLYFTPPKDLNLTVPKILKKIRETPEGYEIRITSDKLVKNAFLRSTLDGDFSDNYFDILPVEEYKVTFTSSARNINPDKLFMISSLIDSY